MSTHPTDRQSVIRWDDPQIGLAQLPALSGIDFLTKMASGELPDPPMSSHLGMVIRDVAHGSVTFEAHPDESHYNPIGMVHGGFVCTLLDSALGCSVHTTLEAGTGYTSIEIKVNFLRPVTAHNGPLTSTWRVTKLGRRVAFAEAEVADNNGKTVATASGSLLIFPLDGE